jgi:hypothetical protein
MSPKSDTHSYAGYLLRSATAHAYIFKVGEGFSRSGDRLLSLFAVRVGEPFSSASTALATTTPLTPIAPAASLTATHLAPAQSRPDA